MVYHCGEPVMRDGWEMGTFRVAHEHFANNVIRGRLLELAQQTRPALILLASPIGDRFSKVASELRKLGNLAPLVLSGEGATQTVVDRCGARRYPEDPVTASQKVPQAMK